MLLWRISNYATLAGRGGISASARWHTAGRPIVYLAETPAGALTEILVQLELAPEELPRSYQLLKISAADDVAVKTVAPGKLRKGWRNDAVMTRTIGDQWLASRETALLRVPSAIVPETWNVLLNPAHTDAPRVRIISHHRYPWDQRLLI